MEKRSVQPAAEGSAGDGDGEEEEDEEMKMEMFFALVRSFKEMRDRRREELVLGCDGDEAAAMEENKRKRMKTVQNRSTWIPKFEREDFDEDFQVRRPAKEETPMKKKKKTRQDCLDLNLAL